MITLGPKDALIVVDAQNDFVEGGNLAVAGGGRIMGDISFLSLNFIIKDALVIITQDWHPAEHKSFAKTWYKEPFSSIEMDYGTQTLWPDHCVKGSKGAQFHRDIEGAAQLASLIIRKGMNPEIDSYSAFMENDKKTLTGLGGYLREKGIERVFFVGLAYDYCVGYSAIDAAKLGLESIVIKDLTAAIDPASAAAIEAEFETSGVKVINRDDFYPIKQQA